MKRLIILCMILCVLASLCVPCLADEAPLTITNTQAKAGQTAYLAVTLNQSVVANTLGVKCEFDETLLTAVPELCTWEKTGIVSAFKAANNGAWTSQTTEDMKGKLFVLAFQIKEGVAFATTSVKCTVVLKNSEKEVGNYVVEGRITMDCDHDYGPWESTGSINHTQICKICGGKSNQMHQWDEGTQTEQKDVIIKTMTCKVCREKKTLEISKLTGDVTPIEPSDEHETPTADGDKVPSKETDPGKQTGATNSSGQVVTKPSGYQNEQEETAPTHEHSHEGATASTGHTHSDSEDTSHDHTGEKTDPAVVWTVVGLIAVTMAGAFFAIRKKQ